MYDFVWSIDGVAEGQREDGTCMQAPSSSFSANPSMSYARARDRHIYYTAENIGEFCWIAKLESGT